jgi:integrase
MATIKFYLKDEGKNGESLIMLTYQKNGKKFRYSTKIKIPTAYWKGQRIKSQYAHAEELNSILEDRENILKEIEREAIFKKEDYSIELIKRKFELNIGRFNNESEFFKLYDKFIEDAKSKRKPATIRAYVTTKNRLLDFQTTKKVEVSFKNINPTFYGSFMDYLIKEKKFLNNTTGKHIKTLKTFLNYALDQEYTHCNFNLKKFKVLQEDVDIIYLTNDELTRLYNLKGLQKHLEYVKDYFCFCCYTGIRFSDFEKITNSNIKQDYLELRTEKTKAYLRIPLNVFAKEILKKYRNQTSERPFPNVISNQKTNDYIKDIAEVAEINDIIELEKYVGTNKKIIKERKFNLITTHTARRTFVTLSLEKGIRAEVVMAMTGHKDYKTFKKYIKISESVLQSEMNRVWNKPLLKAV